MKGLTLPAVALMAAAGYYVASLVGFQLRLAPATTSVLWPPNATLAAILMLTAPRRWPVILLSVLPVHLFIQMHTDFPISLIVALFVTNCSEAVIAAGVMYHLRDKSSPFDTFRGLMGFFVAAVILAPLLSSFGDAAAVMWFRGEPYWRVWQTRLFSNTLAELTVVPAVIGVVLTVLHWDTNRPRHRVIEAGILAFGVAATGWLTLSGSVTGIDTVGALSTQTPLALQLPFLLWAAVRFGPTGTGISVLATSVVSAWGVVHGVGPFAAVPPLTTLPALTISLIVVASALLCLGTLVEERRQTHLTLHIRLEFERLLSRLSAALVQTPGAQLADAFEPWLGHIGRVLGFERLTVFAVSDRGTLTSLYAWTDDGAPELADGEELEHLRYARECLQSHEPVLVPGLDETVRDGLPSASGTGRRAAAIPLIGDRQPIGVLALGSAHGPSWPHDHLAHAEFLGEVLAGALRRTQSEEALRVSQEMKSAILESLTSGVAVLDRTGLLLRINNRWNQLARGRDWLHAEHEGDFLRNCRLGFEHGDRLASNVIVAVSSVLDGSRDRVAVEYWTEAGPTVQWRSLAAVPLNRAEGGAVLTLTDITELRRVEMEAHRSREELAHVSRLATVGEMTASLAHQLNQPLGAILTNAQAGVRIMNSEPIDLNLVREILADIAEDDRRASEVITRLRTLLRKGDLEMTQVNVTAAIRDVVDLVSSEAIIRNVAVMLDFDQEPHFIRGDRVQLQQVILNLLHNAMEALNGEQDGPRRVIVECRSKDAQRIAVSVRDTGPGLNSGTEEVVFEPFYTTKRMGMGLGLSIARSIVEAHGGSICADNHPNGGAVFEFHLPAQIRTP